MNSHVRALRLTTKNWIRIHVLLETEKKNVHHSTHPESTIVKEGSACVSLIGPPRQKRTKFKLDIVFHLPSPYSTARTGPSRHAHMSSCICSFGMCFTTSTVDALLTAVLNGHACRLARLIRGLQDLRQEDGENQPEARAKRMGSRPNFSFRFS